MKRWLLRGLLAWLAWRALGPERAPRFSRPQERPLQLLGRTVPVGEREYFIRESGPEDAPVVALVHGWGADSLLNWFRVIPLLAERYQVVTVDQRNHGKSDRVRGPYRVEEVADEVAEALRAAGVSRATVAGYSMGGMVVQELARRHPELVSGLVLGATAARLPGRARALRRGALWLGRAFERLSGAEGAWLRYRYLLRVGAVEPRHARWLWETFMDRDPALFYQAGLAALDFDSRPWLKEIRCPVLVVIPAADPLVPPAAQLQLAAALPQAQVVELAGAGHEASLTHGEQLSKAMLDFLDAHPALGSTR